MKYKIKTWETGETLAGVDTIKDARAEARRILGVKRMTRADEIPQSSVEGWYGSAKREGCLAVLIEKN
jgi:hypothetical protein